MLVLRSAIVALWATCLNFLKNFNSSYTSTLTPRPPPPPRPDPPPHFFLNHKNFYSSFTSTLTPPQRDLSRPPTPPNFFCIEFSQKLQFFVHIHPDSQPKHPQTDTAHTPPALPHFFFNFLKNFNSMYTSTLTPHSPPPDTPPIFF